MTVLEALDRTVLLCRDFVRPEEVTNQEIVEALTSATVAIVADAPTLKNAAAQAAVVALAGQVLGYGCRLRLIMPEAPIVGFQPPISCPELRRGLVDLAGDLIPGGHAQIADRAAEEDFVFVVGSTPWRGSSQTSWRIGGTRWTGVLARPEDNVPVCSDGFPIGALAAATMAAAEPFKAIMVKLLARKGVERRYEELAPASRATVEFGSDDLAAEPISIGNLDVVSGGAITNAALHVLLRLTRANAIVRVFEPELLELTNLNRYALARRSRLGERKIDVLASWQRTDFTITGAAIRFDEKAPPAVTPLAAHVLVGTDDIPSRWFVQRQDPVWLGVGATIHFSVVVSEHAIDDPCAACLHPEDDDVNEPVATISFVSYWAGLLLAARLIRFLAGNRLAGNRQVVEVATLRTDAPRAVWWHPLQRSARCPVKCGKDS